MFRQKMIEDTVKKLSRQIELIHTSRNAWSLREIPSEYRVFRYRHRDVLEIIKEEHLHLAYQRWIMLSGDYDRQITPIRRVHAIMNSNELHLRCELKFIEELNIISRTLGILPEELFSRVISPVIPGFWCSKDNMVKILNLMLDGLKVK